MSESPSTDLQLTRGLVARWVGKAALFGLVVGVVAAIIALTV